MISRRKVLKGILGGGPVYLSLPLLEQMLNSNGTALAAGGALPVRFGMFFFGNGLPWTPRHVGTMDAANLTMKISPSLTDTYTPATTGKNWEITPLLAPLLNHKNNINVITGLEPKTMIGKSPSGQCDAHMRGTAVVMTGDWINPAGFEHNSHVFTFARASIDQVIAKSPQFYKDGLPLFKSLEMGLSEANLHNFGPWTAMSHNGPNSPNHPIRDAQKFFDHVFAVKSDSTEVIRRASLLSVVAEDARLLKARLGARDKQRLDEHLTHINELERRLKSNQSACGTSPVRSAGAFSDAAELVGRNAAMADILVAALRCDMTRVFTMLLSGPASVMEISSTGSLGKGGKQMHGAVHAGERAVAVAAAGVHLKMFATLLDKMAAEKDVNGLTLLDNSVVLATSDQGEGFSHSHKEHPLIMAGRAGGKLETGWHVREEGGNLSTVHITMLRALGFDMPSFGFNGGETSKVMPFMKTAA